jgi:hemolysin III
MIKQPPIYIHTEIAQKKVKPLMRGWSHALAAVASIVLTVILCVLSRHDIPRMISMLIFGLSMIELYTVSAVYHIVTWSVAKRRVLRAIDHGNIFVLIAGTYTPLCFNILTGWLRITILAIIWTLALAGIVTSIFTVKLPRWATAALYVGMGWVVILAIPAFLAVLPWISIAILFLGGLLYTIGAVIYARKKPDPFPTIWGYHEVFHLFVILGSAAFVTCVWVWALPFPRV